MKCVNKEILTALTQRDPPLHLQPVVTEHDFSQIVGLVVQVLINLANKQQKLELEAEKKARLDKIASRMAEVVAGSKKKIEEQAAKRAAGSLHLPPLMMCTYGAVLIAATLHMLCIAG